MPKSLVRIKGSLGRNRDAGLCFEINHVDHVIVVVNEWDGLAGWFEGEPQNVERTLGEFEFTARAVKEVVPELCIFFHSFEQRR